MVIVFQFAFFFHPRPKVQFIMLTWQIFYKTWLDNFSLKSNIIQYV